MRGGRVGFGEERATFGAKPTAGGIRESGRGGGQAWWEDMSRGEDMGMGSEGSAKAGRRAGLLCDSHYVQWNMPRRVTALCVTPAGEAGLHGPARSETDEVRRRTLRSLCAACNAHRRRSGTAGGVAMMSLYPCAAPFPVTDDGKGHRGPNWSATARNTISDGPNGD